MLVAQSILNVLPVESCTRDCTAASSAVTLVKPVARSTRSPRDARRLHWRPPEHWNADRRVLNHDGREAQRESPRCARGIYSRTGSRLWWSPDVTGVPRDSAATRSPAARSVFRTFSSPSDIRVWLSFCPMRSALILDEYFSGRRSSETPSEW